VQITTTVELEGDDSFAYTPAAAASQVLAALGGNPTTDFCVVTVHMPANAGNAGTPPATGLGAATVPAEEVAVEE
jgi:hypothetical protein